MSKAFVRALDARQKTPFPVRQPHPRESSIRILPGQYPDKETGLAYSYFPKIRFGGGPIRMSCSEILGSPST
jgi:hypothetical protein